MSDDDARADVVLQNVALDTEEKSRCDEKKKKKTYVRFPFQRESDLHDKGGMRCF